MEQARRPALAHHVHRTAPMGPRVLINGIWYNGGLCATASPSVGPREANFFPYLSIQLPPVGDHLLGLGITRFRLAWKVRALTRLSPWGGLRARRFQRDISAQSDRQGGFRLAGQLVTVV